jgi:hypothetical protein
VKWPKVKKSEQNKTKQNEIRAETQMNLQLRK